MAWYKEWFGTRYYTLLYGHRDQHDAQHWVTAILQRLQLRPGQALLDLGCGRGRHAAGFARAGVDVTGIDLSEASIREARAFVPQAHFFVHDMREPFATGRFDAVVCLFTSLGYSGSREDDQRALDNAALALRPGGWLVLDLLNGAYVRHALVGMECLFEKGVRFTIDRCVEGDDIVKRIDVDDHGEVHHFTERVHAWSATEVLGLVKHAGLVPDEPTAGPDPAPFDPERSPRIVVWARKPLPAVPEP